MARGGKRPGAGRRRGVPNKVTQKRREIAEDALRAGVTPLEVMLGTMRALWALATEQAGNVNAKLAKEAADIAKDAAPYVHPKLAAIEHSGRIDFNGVSDGDVASELESIAAAAGYALVGAGAGHTQAPGSGQKKPH